MEQRSFSICDRNERKRRSPEYRKFIDRAVLLIVTSVIVTVLFIHIISSIVIYRRISNNSGDVSSSNTINCSNNHRRNTTTTAGIFSWNLLTSPLEVGLNCVKGRKIPLDLIGSKISNYFLYLCQNSSVQDSTPTTTNAKTPYRKLILLNGSRTLEEAVSFTWSNLDFLREYCLYCIHSVAYCGQMLKLKLHTNRDSEDCYYSYVISNIFVCLNQNQEVTRGLIGSNNIFDLSRRELFQFCDIIEYWF